MLSFSSHSSPGDELSSGRLSGRCRATGCTCRPRSVWCSSPLSAAASLTAAGVGPEVGGLFALTVDIGSASRPVDEHLLKEFCLGFSWGSICRAGCCWGTVEPPHPLRSLCRLPLASRLPERSDVRWKLTWSAAQRPQNRLLWDEPAVFGGLQGSRWAVCPRVRGPRLGPLSPSSASCRGQRCLDALMCLMGPRLCFSKQGCPALCGKSDFPGCADAHFQGIPP